LKKEYIIQPLSGFTPHVGVLLSMMEKTRETTKERVANLSTAQLDWRFDAAANSIGMLLGHIAAVEEIYTIQHLEVRENYTGRRAFLKTKIGSGQRRL
jgi:hypothetical protein